ncbi:uncharacterized protein LOC110010064 isoform X2 [Jatropha curcas]|uniref:uncharacterized protein LOC110010064 isoform X2 n=1 Tax=Jatropha curcas TaxID=180498 RepID=UPI0018950C00|nr:uncharacterized protein LOC110010064 isoform X2 [Jatropha curcas]
MSPSPSSNSPCPSSQSLNSPFQPSFPFPPSLTSSSHVAGPPSATVIGPCAACKILGQRCTDKCYIASYFPSTTEPHKFTVVGSLFGDDDIVDYLQNSSSSSYVPLLLLLRDTSKDGTQLQSNPSKTSNINGQRQSMLANSENSKAHSYSSSSKPLIMMFGTNDDKGTLTSPANHLGDNIDLNCSLKWRMNLSSLLLIKGIKLLIKMIVKTSHLLIPISLLQSPQRFLEVVAQTYHGFQLQFMVQREEQFLV